MMALSRITPHPGIPGPFTGPPLKICIASMAPFVGGAEVAAERLGRGLLDAGHDVLMLLGQDGDVRERMERAGLRCICAAMRFTDKWSFLRYLHARRDLSQVLRAEQPDVLHSNDLTTHQIMSDAARRLGIPRVCHHRFPFPGPAIDWLNKYGAERHFFVSRALMEEMCVESRQLRDAKRSVVYDGLPLPPVPTASDRQQARARLGLPEDRTVVTFAGQIIERKGVADLIRAWSLLPLDVRQGAELVIVGDDLAGRGTYRAAMEQLARDVGCPARFVGFQKIVAEWLLASDLAAVPSHVEPLGNATLEAMAHGLPVIGGDVGGIPEMIVHAQTGLLVPPRDPVHLARALERLLIDPVERSRLGAESRRRCEERFSLPAHIGAVLAEYGHVLRPPC